MDRPPTPSPGSASPARPERTCPELKTAKWDRKRGTYSYHRFDDRVRGPASVGGASLGSVQVDLKWNFRQSQWGCIDGDKPAGILYLDIGLHQQADYKLVSIVVEVTLEDVQEKDAFMSPAHKTPVQMTDWFGPKQILGREHVQRVTKDSKFKPSLEGFGFGVGGVGKSSQSEALVRSRWEFAGRLKRPSRTKKGSVGGTHYKTLEWTVSENELESARNNTIHVAFTFEHGGEPFHMRAKVEGTLRSKLGRFMHGLRDLRFGPRHGQHDDVSTTYIGTYTGYRMPLDELAQGLDLAMQEKNWRSRPTEIPEPQQATFEETGPPPGACSTSWSLMAEPVGETGNSGQEARPGQPALAPADPFQHAASAPQSEMQLSLERLAMAGQRFAALPKVEAAPEDRLEMLGVFSGLGQPQPVAAGQSLSAIPRMSRPSTASVLSKVSSATTLVGQVDQAAAPERLPGIAQEPSSPPAGRKSAPDVDAAASKQRGGLLGLLPRWIAAIIRLYLLLWVGIPLRCLRAVVAVAAAILGLVGGVEGRISRVLAKHAQI